MHDQFPSLVDNGCIMAKRIAVTGRGGNLDTVLVERFKCIRLDADITNKYSIREEINRIEPDVIINCAAYTAVDDAEKNRRTAMEVNSAGICNLKDEFFGQLIYISTDYIFDGTSGPYKEDAEPCPIGYYGKTKWCGEQMLMEYSAPNDVIVRTTVLYGGHKPDFANTVLKKLKFGFDVEITDKLYGSPTHIHHLAEALIKLLKLKHPPKIINISGSDVINRYDFGKQIAEMFGYDVNKIKPNQHTFWVSAKTYKSWIRCNFSKETETTHLHSG